MTSEERHPEWQAPELRDLLNTISNLQGTDEIGRFLRDLCTLSELEALAHRWDVAQLLEEGLPYLEVAQKAGASTTTVTRVAHWLRHGEGGYQIALERYKREATSTA